jgi:hypothetical protein
MRPKSKQLPKAGITVDSAADCYERERAPRRERPISDWLPSFVALSAVGFIGFIGYGA